MGSIEKRTVALPAEHASFIDAQVASGAYASADDVIRAGLRALQDQEAAVDRWLHQDVAPAFDAMQADPSRALTVDLVFDEIRAHHARQLKERA